MSIGYCGDPASRLGARHDDHADTLAAIRMIVSDALSGEVDERSGLHEIDRLLPYSVDHYRRGGALD